jgi:hypothetical protein
VTFAVTTDKQQYAAGEVVTATVTGVPSTTVTLTATAEAQTASTSYQVTGGASGVSLSDSHGGTWAQKPSPTPGETVFTSIAGGIASGFGGAEPPVAGVPGAISWSGYTWEVENWGTANGQPAAANVKVNDGGQLVLSLANSRGAELDSARGDAGISGNPSTWGYGTYKWVIDTDLSTLPAPVIFGLFTYWAASKGGPAGQKEIDIEAGPMGISGAPSFLQLGFYQDTAAGTIQAVPPYHTLLTGSQVAAKSSPQTTMQFTWLPDSITWEVFYGKDTTPDYSLTMTQGEDYSYVQPYGGNTFSGTVNIPATGKQQVIMNLWTASQQPVSSPVVVIIDSFTYTEA